MGLYIFNLSADTPDPKSPHIAEDLTINDQESIVEVLVETVLGFEDTFEEFDDPDGEEQNNKSVQKVVLALHNPAELQQLLNSPFEVETRFSDLKIALSIGFHHIDSPPPNS
ncbi:hypothetical protein FHS59_000569 [Algoriphagus iocasae]|uniref:Uncharacterized protein n=1 Tax=Algoriphagus iocasae TaxID=1836499 RepID=A0A841MJB3_9BACT|nr:hypothetical protein [Algoriphagus iocasae]MBB6324954.1 hypothetical protein [Algoriphagus iocasae]